MKNDIISRPCLEEGLHANDEVLFAGRALDGLNGNRLGQVKVLQQGLASQAVTAVDALSVPNAVCAQERRKEGTNRLLPLDLVEHPTRGRCGTWSANSSQVRLETSGL